MEEELGKVKDKGEKAGEKMVSKMAKQTEQHLKTIASQAPLCHTRTRGLDFTVWVGERAQKSEWKNDLMKLATEKRKSGWCRRAGSVSVRTR